MPILTQTIYVFVLSAVKRRKTDLLVRVLYEVIALDQSEHV